MEKTSYSKISTYEQCPYKYKLVYIDKHFINQPSIATDFGTLIHYVEEHIGIDLKNHKDIDYVYFKNLFLEGNEEVKGLNKLKELYPIEFITPDKNNRTYEEKANTYLTEGIYRLEEHLRINDNLEIYGTEVPFEFEYGGYIIHGFIDRIFKDTIANSYIIEDIKTYSAPLEHKDLVTPLQFVIYVKALQTLVPNLTENDIVCYYDLPLCYEKQQAGTNGFIKRGFAKIDKLFKNISEKIFAPKATPLCHWCIFCPTVDNQPEEAKGLCPYYSHWTRENKDNSVENYWMGEENHQAILEAFRKGESKPKIKIEVKNNDFVLEVDELFNKRRFLISNR